MIKKFVGSISLLTLFSCGPVFADQQPSAAEAREMLDEQVRTTKAQIEEQDMEEQYKIYGEMSQSFALAVLTGMCATDAILKMVDKGIGGRNMTFAIVSSLATAWTLLNVTNGARRLGKLSADKEAKLQELEATAHKLRHMVLQMERQARAEAEKKQSDKQIDTPVIESGECCKTAEEPVKTEDTTVAGADVRP